MNAPEIQLADGVVSLDRGTQRFRYAAGVEASEPVEGVVTDVVIDRETGTYSATLTVLSGADAGTYLVTVAARDREFGFGQISVTAATGAAVELALVPQAPPQQGVRSPVGFRDGADASESAERMPSLPPHPAVLVVGAAVVLIVVLDDAWNGPGGPGESPYSCVGWWDWFWNGCWLP